MGNALRNYCHLVACEQSGEAILIDPLDAEICLEEAKRLNVRVTKVVNTHEHFDHIEGNPDIVSATGAMVHAHASAIAQIPNVDVGLQPGDVVEVGSSVRLRVLDTPGHTMAHVCLLSEIGEAAFFCGDTLFNAGVGNCHYGGDVNVMYHTFVEQIFKLPDYTRIYPGHDYIVNNLNFSLSLEPGNEFARCLLDEVIEQSPEDRAITMIEDEKHLNPFFRLGNKEILSSLRKRFADQQDDPLSVFASLRRVRDEW